MISVTILTKNCADSLKKTLHSIRDFDEVIVLDSGSTDATIAVAREFSNVKVIEHPFIGFGAMHNLATSLAKNDWILSLDSDEVLFDEAAQEILSLSLSSHTVYALLRHNYFNGKWIKWCSGWHPDWVKRLYHRSHTAFSEAKVHETLLSEGLQVEKLRGVITHTPYRNMSDFLDKMQNYSTLFASQNKGKKTGSVLGALLRSYHAFIKSYIFKRGFLGGKEGFIISLYNGHTTFYKYMKLLETFEK